MININDSTKIYVMCPAQRATGGPLALHQLAYELKKIKINTFMYYVDIDPEKKDLIHENYKNLNIPFVTNIEDKAKNVLIVPETSTHELFEFKYLKKCIWWLSIDNFYKSLEFRPVIIRLLDKLGLVERFKFSRDLGFYHFAQSKYAYDYLINKGVDTERVAYLTDYIQDIFIESANEINNKNKENNVLYNPKKGEEFTNKLIEANQDLNWIPIQNMTPREVKDLLSSSKLYVDFGEHPGRDRFPREAALCGCGIITGKRGAAENDIDVCIPKKYKFDDSENSIPEISTEIRSFLQAYRNKIQDFEDYVNFIKNNKSNFKKEVKIIFNDSNTAL